jgi:hypothetical protein
LRSFASFREGMRRYDLYLPYLFVHFLLAFRRQSSYNLTPFIHILKSRALAHGSQCYRMDDGYKYMRMCLFLCM